MDVLPVQVTGGWSSLQMPRPNVEESKLANEGVA
jgi:hypothetical protein